MQAGRHCLSCCAIMLRFSPGLILPPPSPLLQFPYEPLKFLPKSLRLTFAEGIQMLQEAGYDVSEAVLVVLCCCTAARLPTCCACWLALAATATDSCSCVLPAPWRHAAVGLLGGAVQPHLLACSLLCHWHPPICLVPRRWIPLATLTPSWSARWASWSRRSTTRVRGAVGASWVGAVS